MTHRKFDWRWPLPLLIVSAALIFALIIMPATAAPGDRSGAPDNLPPILPGSSQTSLFPVVVPWDDARPTFLDLSALNRGPAGSHGYIIVRDGHFVESGDGRRIRFLAVDFTFSANFPDHADADRVAARMAKYGVNLVRLHHMDNESGQSGSLLDYSTQDHRHLNLRQLDNLDYLIAQLKRHGIYVNINLHVSRTFTPADGFPQSVNDIPFSFDKRVDYFDPKMIALQKEYARELLTHRNPYTGYRYTQEPAVLNVEITNEDSLVGDPWAPKGTGLDTLPQPFEGELQALWNTWLSHRYRSTRALRAAWRSSATPPGPNILRPTTVPASWTLEQHEGTAATMAPDGDAIKVSIDKVDGTDWHLQLHQNGLNLINGDTYTVAFRARADAPRTMGVYTGMDRPDWRHVGLDTQARLTPEWKSFQYVFEVNGAVPNASRISFTLG